MEENKEQDFLADYFNSLKDEFIGFSKEYPELWMMFNICHEVIQSIQLTITARYELSSVEVHRLMMWQTVFHYQTEALILILSRKLDAGYALIRLAAELSRDLSCIGDDQSLLKLWMDYRSPSKKSKITEHDYKNTFRFNTKTSAGAYVFRVYKLCSEFGVHGHFMESISSVPNNTVGSGTEEIAILRITEKALLEAVQIWLDSFGPVQQLCLNTFLPRTAPDLTPAFQLFYDLQNDIGKISQSLSDWLKNAE